MQILRKNRVPQKIFFSIVLIISFVATTYLSNNCANADTIPNNSNYEYYHCSYVQGSAIDDFFDNHIYNKKMGSGSTRSIANTLENNLAWNGNAPNDPTGYWDSVGGYWTDDYLNYNCYSFAIGKNDDRTMYPGIYSGAQYDSFYYYVDYTISDMALLTESDLMYLNEIDPLNNNYTNISVWDYEPSIQYGQKLICIRRGDFDFHFMKYDTNNSYWLHKPNITAPLQYLHNPNDMIWVEEFSFYGVSYNSNDIINIDMIPNVYYSDIYYLTYGSQLFITGNYDGNYSILGVKSGAYIEDTLSIPEEINGELIIGIAPGAFSNCTEITGVTIPKTITTIGHNAFEGCTSLETVIFRDNSTLTSIDYQAFKGCTSLEKIVLPSSLTTFGNQVFYNCSNLEEVYIKNTTNVLSLGSSVFSYTSNDLVIYVPSSLYSSYYSSLYWTSYVNKLDKMYLDAGGWYLEEYDYISMEGYIFLETLYNYNYTMDPNNDGFLIGNVGIVGEYLYYCYVHCCLDYLGEGFADCHLLIDVDGGTGCYLIDEDLEIITSCYITNYVLDVPLFDILNGGYEEFYLYPFENCNESFSFTDSDVTLEIMFKVYLDI